MHIAMLNVPGGIAAGMTGDEILFHYPYLTIDDIYVCFEYAIVSQNRIVSLRAAT